MESGGGQEAGSSTPPQGRITLGDDNPIEEKRRKLESGCGEAVVPLGDDGRSLDQVMSADIIPDCKHGDGSINTSTDFWSKVFCLNESNETCLEPMMMKHPLKSCLPFWKVCEKHHFRPMMQIFSLKLTCSVDGPIQLYGYMAVRDLLNPWRNYIFNRTRDDPFSVGQDGFIQMTGPKRCIRMSGYVLMEYDMKIKRGEDEGDDLQLIDGAACFNNLAFRHAIANTQRIRGDCGVVDIAFAKMHNAAEATIHVGISKLEHGCCLSMCVTASYSDIDEVIQLFDGAIAAEKPEVKRSLVAVSSGTKLGVTLKLSPTGGSSRPLVTRRLYVFDVRKHGGKIIIVEFGFAAVDVKVMWSTLDIDERLLGPNCYKSGADAVNRIECNY